MPLALGLGLWLGGQQGGQSPPPGYAFVTTNGGTRFVTTNGGANRVTVKVP